MSSTHRLHALIQYKMTSRACS